MQQATGSTSQAFAVAAILVGSLVVLGAWGEGQPRSTVTANGTPTYPARGRWLSIDCRYAVIDQIRGFAATEPETSLPTILRVSARASMPTDGWPQLASLAETGPIFGLAHDGSRGLLYAGARPRSYTPLGARSPGQIYEVASTNAFPVRPWAVLDAGPMEKDVAAGEYDHLIDRWGLGDLEIDDEARWLFTVNLYDRRIYRLSLPGGDVLDSFAIGSAHAAWAANARPFGLGWNDGWLYHGVVDSREDPTLPGSVSAYVYRSRPTGAEMGEVLRAELPARWQPWQEPAGGPIAAQPVLADIEFRHNGDLILAMRNRAHD